MVALAEFYAEVPQTVKALQRLGIHLAIVSQKTRRYIQPILEKENLLEAFEAIVGGGDAAYKPDPEGYCWRLLKQGVVPKIASTSEIA